MGVLDKCCGNCKHSYAKDMDGYCACGVDDHFTSCDEVCDRHILSINGWAEITPDNIDEIRKSKKKIVIMNPKEWDVPEMLYSIKADSLVLYSEWGGYYYYILPELKIE